MFIGYSTTQKGYKCYDPVNKRYLVSQDVKFIEDRGYYEEKDWESLNNLATPTDKGASLRFLLDNLGVSTLPTKETTEANEATEEMNEEAAEDPTEETGGDCTELNEESTADTTRSEGEFTEDIDTATEEAVASVPPLRRSERIRSDPSTWKEKRVFYNNEAVAHPIQAVCSLALLPSDHQAFMGKIDEHIIPKTFEEAMESEEWTVAVDDEVVAMVKNHTWDEADLPEGKRAVSSKWVFTIKHLSIGEIERFKARLVARGFTLLKKKPKEEE